MICIGWNRGLYLQNKQRKNKPLKTKIMKLHIYNMYTKEIEVIIEGSDNKECEDYANTLKLDQDEYCWAYSDAGLVETNQTTIIEL